MAGNIFKRKPTVTGSTDLKRLSGTEAAQAQSSFNIEKITDIQNHFTRGEVLLVPGRLFIREGSLWKICRKGPKKRQFFLFNDILVYGSILSRGLYSNQHILPISSMTVSSKCHYMPQVELETVGEGGGKEELDPDNAFQINHADKSFHVFALTKADKTNWIANLTKQINKLNKDAEDTTAMLYKAVWVPDSVTNQCMLCKQKFSAFVRKHHCRMCGRIVCSQCSPHKADIAQLSGAKPSGKTERVCRQCNKPLVLCVGEGNDVLDSPKGPPVDSKPREEEERGKEDDDDNDSTETEDSDDSEAEELPIPPPRKKKQQKEDAAVKPKQAPPPRPAPPKLSPAATGKKVPPPRPQTGPKSPPPPPITTTSEPSPVPLPRKQTTPTFQRKEEEPVPVVVVEKPVAPKRTKLLSGGTQNQSKEEEGKEETVKEEKEEEEKEEKDEEEEEVQTIEEESQEPTNELNTLTTDTEEPSPPTDEAPSTDKAPPTDEAPPIEESETKPSEGVPTENVTDDQTSSSDPVSTESQTEMNKKVPVNRRKKYQSDTNDSASTASEIKIIQASPHPPGGRSPSVNARPRKSKFAPANNT